MSSRQSLDRLRAQIAALEGHRAGFGSYGRHAVLDFGLPAMDAVLPGGGLHRAGVHEFLWCHQADWAAAFGCCLALVLRHEQERPLLWCRLAHDDAEYGMPYAHGLAHLGLDPNRVLLLSLKRPTDILWAMEEGLKCGALGAVVGMVASDLRTSRRLALAAEAGKTPGFLLHPAHAAMNTAAQTRWRVGAAPGTAQAFKAQACWTLALIRNRHGGLKQWTVEWHHETHSFHLVAALANRTSAAGHVWPNDGGRRIA